MHVLPSTNKGKSVVRSDFPGSTTTQANGIITTAMSVGMYISTVCRTNNTSYLYDDGHFTSLMFPVRLPPKAPIAITMP